LTGVAVRNGMIDIPTSVYSSYWSIGGGSMR